MLYNHMARHGRSWFVGAIFIMSVSTYVLAVYIGNVLDFFKYPPPQPGGRGKKSPRNELEAMEQGEVKLVHGSSTESHSNNDPTSKKQPEVREKTIDA